MITPVKSDVQMRGQIAFLMSVNVLISLTETIVGMIPLGLLIVSPFCVVEVFLLSRLKIAPTSSSVLISASIHLLFLVDLVFNIISLSRNCVGKHFIGFVNFLEIFGCQRFFMIGGTD